MSAALRAEFRKLVTTRLWWILLIVMAAYMAFLAAIMAFTYTVGAEQGSGGGFGGSPAALPPEEIARTVYALAPTLGYVFPVIVGALSVTGEFRHKTVTPTFLTEPRRSVVLGAKLLASLPVGLAIGLVGTLATVGTGAGVLALVGEPTFLGDGDIQTLIARSVLALTVWTMVGVGFGTVLTNQVAAVVVLLAFNQFVEPVLRALAGSFEPTQGLARFLPGAAGDAITGASLFSAMGMGGLLEWWQGLLVLVGYGLVLALAGRLTTLRRDIT